MHENIDGRHPRHSVKVPLLAQGLADARPHRNDARITAVISSLPPYVASRYKRH